MEKILVIKLGALGDFVQAMGAFKAIRQYHDDAEITVMTTPPFEKMAKDCGYFDKVWIDPRKPFYNLNVLLQLKKGFRNGQYNRVYDLQCVSRTNLYFRFLMPKDKPQWSGLAPGCSHPHTDLKRSSLHTFDRHRQQLQLAGISQVPDPDLEWVTSDLKNLQLPPRFVLLIPGVAPGGSRKQWPARCYGELSTSLVAQGITPIILGSQLEKATAKIIQSFCPEALDFTNKTSLYDLIELGRSAEAAVGNDTGPTHMIALAGCPITVVFSGYSDPALFGPRGENVNIVQNDNLQDLKTEEVWTSLSIQLQKTPATSQVLPYRPAILSS